MNAPKTIKRSHIKLILALLLFLSSLYLFGYIVYEVLWEKEETFDTKAASFISQRLLNSRLTPAMEVITFFASAYFLAGAYLVLIFWYAGIKKNKRLSLYITAIATGGFLLGYILKLVFKRVRPIDPMMTALRNYSFPSGHAISGFVFYGLLVYLVWQLRIKIQYKYWGTVVLILFSLLIGFSRIYLRMHYTSDVIAGFCIGFSWLAFSVWMLDRLGTRNNRLYISASQA
jgi:membrane-associated phospholipid phosphatase